MLDPTKEVSSYSIRRSVFFGMDEFEDLLNDKTLINSFHERGDTADLIQPDDENVTVMFHMSKGSSQ